MATHRRRFLKTIAASGIASPCLVRAVVGHAAPEAIPEPSRREILLTSAQSPLGQALAGGLGPMHRLRLTARTAVPAQPGVRVSDLAADDHTSSLVRGVEAIVHLPGADSPSGPAERLDLCTRCTYNLLQAAVREGVKHFIHLSSLAPMTGYAGELAVDEDWRPSPKGETSELAEYLGEVVSREFAREGKIHVVVLRLGKVVQAKETGGQPFDPLWVDQADVVQAVSLALAAQLDKNGPRLGTWSVLHILSGSRRARFSIEKAKRLLTYEPHFPGVEQ